MSAVQHGTATSPRHIAALEAELARCVDRRTPGLQYLVIDPNRVVFEFAGGYADLANRAPMRPTTALMAYSLTKTVTALAVLQLTERGQLRLDQPLGDFLPECPYPPTITIRQLLCHTAGVPNPIPLRWVHLVADHDTFDERAALATVLQRHSRLAFAPGARYGYSNIGYWLLGQIVAAVSGEPYVDYVRTRILERLRLAPEELSFAMTETGDYAHGYLERRSLLNLIRRWVTDDEFWGPAQGKWLRVNRHYMNGPAFGGLIGSARAFGRFLSDQLAPESALLGPEMKALFYARQTRSDGSTIPMTLGWHIGAAGREEYYFKEGGGGGFHSEMRLYPRRRLGTVIFANSTLFKSSVTLDRLDAAFLS